MNAGMNGKPLSPREPDEDARAIVAAMLDKQEPVAAVHARYFAPDAVAQRARNAAERAGEDWAELSRYRAANAAIGSPPDLVMIGDSLTEIWPLAMPDLFDGTVVNRGISGQTSPQILLRFMADVIDLSPHRVHILCGTNDIAGNTGPNQPEDFQRNIRAMVDLAMASGIDVLIGSILPAAQIFWQPEARPDLWIPRLNRFLRELAQQSGARFVDYAAILDDGSGGLQDIYSADGVHVTRAAYRAMTELLLSACEGDRGT